MNEDADVLVIGAGGGGPVIAKELGELGLKVMVLEAGPWYGHKKWPDPNRERGASSSSSSDDLDVFLYKQHLNMDVANMNDPLYGRFRWGPADRRCPPWLRNIQGNGAVWQNAGVGGTTQHYWGNSPRPYPHAVDNVWPIAYRDMIPYFEKVEATLPVEFAPTTVKEELFYYGAKKAGWPLIATFDVTSAGYRPQPNAILPPNENLTNPAYSLEQLSWMEGCTLRGQCMIGCTSGPTVDTIAKRSTAVSYVPLALRTGHVVIRPNTFVTRILTEDSTNEGTHAIGIRFRDTWTGEAGELYSKAVVMAAGSIETPRLWLNSGLPHNSWVGRGMTTHYFDTVSGVFEERDLMAILGTPSVDPFVGHNSGARLDYPGLGSLMPSAMPSPALMSLTTYAFSQSGYNFQHRPEPDAPWDIRGRIVGPELKEIMTEYRRTMSILIITDDEVDRRNGITLDPIIQDEHGPVPVLRYTPTRNTLNHRDQLARLAADILRNAGARKIIRSDYPPNLFAHMQSSMRMGYVMDISCEAYQVKRLYIADNSADYNSLGGVNPTLTTQALATRTAEKIYEKYFN